MVKFMGAVFLATFGAVALLSGLATVVVVAACGVVSRVRRMVGR